MTRMVRLVNDICSITAVALLAIGCSGEGPRLPTAPGSASTASSGEQGVSARSAAAHGLPLIAVRGTGTGVLNVTGTANDHEGSLNTQATISVHGVAPNTTLYLLRSADQDLVPASLVTDGICQRGNAGMFQPAPTPTGSIVQIHASPGGGGATHVEFTRTGVPDGLQFDAMWKLVDALPPATPTIELRSACFLFTVK